MPEPETNDTPNPSSAAGTTDAGTPPPAPESAEAALVTAKAEAAANLDRFMRAAADLENFRRRTVREKEELRLFAASRVLEDLLPVLDNLGLALAAARQPGADVKALMGGVDMVLAQLKSALSSHGLKEISPAGAAFDANLHESISAQASADVPEGSVVSVVRPGFSLNGRLLRPASVVVSSGPAKSGSEKPAK